LSCGGIHDGASGEMKLFLDVCELRPRFHHLSCGCGDLNLSKSCYDGHAVWHH